jgi:dTDP-glucose pyrophosphorylase
MRDARDYTVRPDEPIVSALRRLDETAHKCLFVVDERGRLMGSLTDGDIRRHILRAGTIDGTVSSAMFATPATLGVDERLRAARVIAERHVPALPLLDGDGKIVDIVFDDGASTRRAQLREPVPVVMMAGGVGSRLLPLTAVIPKPLIPIEGTTIAERIINRFRESGCNDFYLILNYKKKMIEAYFDDLDRDYDVTYLEEEKFLGTGGGLKLAEPYLKSTFILTNCDILVDASATKLYEAHKESGNAVTMVCSLKSFTIPYGAVDISGGGQLVGMREKPTMSVLVNTGCYMVEPEVLQLIGVGENIGFPDVMARCQENGLKVGIYPISEGSWLDMGQFDEMERMNAALSGKAKQ